jgi:hypothetical protein
MTDPKDIIKKAQSILDELDNRYDSNGDISKSYYEELEKDIFDSLKRRKSEQNVPKPGTDLLQHFQGPKPEPQPVPQQAPLETPQKPIDAVHQAKEQVAPKADPWIHHLAGDTGSDYPMKPASEDEEIYAYAQSHPKLQGHVKRSDTNALLNHINKRVAKMIKEGEVVSDLDIEDLQKILDDLNKSKTPGEVFGRFYKLAKQPISPEAAPATGAKGQSLAPTTYGSRDAFRHLRNSVYKHIPMDDEVENAIKSVMEGYLQSGVKNSVPYKVAMTVLDKSKGESIKDAAKNIGKELANMIGDLNVPTEKMPEGEEKQLRLQALALSEGLRDIMGLNTYLSKSRLGRQAFLIKGNLGLPMSEQEQAAFKAYQEKNVNKSMDDFDDWDNIEDGDWILADAPVYLIIKRV